MGLSPLPRPIPLRDLSFARPIPATYSFARPIRLLDLFVCETYSLARPIRLRDLSLVKKAGMGLAKEEDGIGLTNQRSCKGKGLAREYVSQGGLVSQSNIGLRREEGSQGKMCRKGRGLAKKGVLQGNRPRKGIGLAREEISQGNRSRKGTGLARE